MIFSDFFTGMNTSTMPRHLMVRRGNASNEPDSRTSDNQCKTPLTGCYDNVESIDNRKTSLGISTESQPDSSQWSVDMSTEMAWCDGSLNEPVLQDDIPWIADDLCSRNLPDSNSETRIECDFLTSQANCRQNSQIARSARLPMSSFNEIRPLSQPGLHFTNKSIKSPNRNPSKCDPESSDSYRHLGVKKNFLQRSCTLGYSRLHKPSPSKNRHLHPTQKPVDENAVPLTYNGKGKQNHNQYYPISSTPVSERNSTCKPTSKDASYCLGISSVDDASPSPKKVLSPWKQSLFNINRGGALAGRHKSPSKIQKPPNGGVVDSTECLNIASNGVRRALHKQTFEASSAVSELNPAVRLPLGGGRVRADHDLSSHSTQPEVLDLRKISNVNVTDFAHDNKENIQQSSESPKLTNISSKKPCSRLISQNESLRDIVIHAGHFESLKITDEGSQQTRLLAGYVSKAMTKIDKAKTMDQIRASDYFSSDQATQNKLLASLNFASMSISSTSQHKPGFSDDALIRVESPLMEQEINNPDELPPSVEIDVVGDLPPTVTSSTSVDSGVASDLSASANDSTHGQHVQLVDYRAYDPSNYPARIPFIDPAASSFFKTDPFATPERSFPSNTMFTSTPVSQVWSPWLPQSSLNIIPFRQPNHYPYISSAATPSSYTMLQPPTAISHQFTGSSPHIFAVNRHRYPIMPPQTGLLGNPPFPNPPLSTSLPLDLPLNLTNRRSSHIPASDNTTPRLPSYPTGPARNLFPMNSPQPGNTPSYRRPVQRPFSVYDTHSLPSPSYSLPQFLTLPQEFPLNMSITGKRPNTSMSDSLITDCPTEQKKRRASKSHKQCDTPRQLTEIHLNREDVKMEPQFHTSMLSISEQQIKGVILGSAPRGARPISFLVKSKEKMDGVERKTIRATRRCKENVMDGENETKQRNKPELFGDTDICELRVEFYDCPERARFCDGNLNFQVPRVPDGTECQSELRLALLRLFACSNLPQVPSALQHSVHALSQYPFMQHVFSLHSQGVNLDTLKFGAYGLAFENTHLVDLGDQKFNDILDKMSYLGEDGLLHCLVQSEKTGTLCGHVAHEIGKIRRHSKNHYPDKKWVCVFCRVQMCDMTDLERHTATHTELKPFECPQCSKKFCQKVTLTQHMNKGHGQKLTKWDAKSSYICRQDGCSFSQGEEMACVRHLKQHHSHSDYLKRKNQNKWPFNCVPEEVLAGIDED